jgi:D-amino peptidase
MKIFIAVDMEGITGVVHGDQLMAEGRGYAAAQRLLMGDVYAALEGIRRVYPDAIVRLGDGHATMRNIILDDLPANVEVVVGPARPENKPLCQLEGLDASFNMMMQLGYHSKAGTPGGLLAHTYIGSLVSSWKLNGREVGEITMNTALATCFGVPMCFVSGNSDLAAEAAELPNTPEFVATKSVLGPTAAICMPPSKTRALIADGVERALRRTWERPGVSDAPATIEVATHRREQAARGARVPGVELVGDNVMRVQAATVQDAYRTMWQACTVAMEEQPGWLQ